MFYTRYVELCKENNISPSKAAESNGLSRTTVTKWKNGALPSGSTIQKLADYFDVTADYLIGNVNEPYFYLDNERILKEINSYGDETPDNFCDIRLTSDELAHVKKYRALDEHGKKAVDSCLTIEYERFEQEQEQCLWKLQLVCGNEGPKPEDNVFQLIHSLQDASAGTGYYLDSEQMVPWTVKYNELTRKADFSVNVNGDSMEPKFHNGDTLLIRQQPSVDVGEIGLYIVDGKGYVKQQGDTCLISLNPDYEDIHLNEYSSVKCVGKVLGVLKPEWIVEK